MNMNYPKRAIADLRAICARDSEDSSSREVLAYLDWLEGKHVVEWPAELTRERLEMLADGLENRVIDPNAMNDALRALAAIAPQKKKRVVNLYRDVNGFLHEREKREPESSWRKVAGPIEIED